MSITRKILGGKPNTSPCPPTVHIVDSVHTDGVSKSREDRIRARYKVRIVYKAKDEIPWHVYVSRFGIRLFHDYEFTESAAIKEAKRYINTKVAKKVPSAKTERVFRGHEL